MRSLRHHEAKLLKRASLYDWKGEHSISDHVILRRNGISERKELLVYRRTIAKIHEMVRLLIQLPQDNRIRIELTRRLIRVLYDMGVINNINATLLDLRDIKSQAFLDRRLPCIMLRLKMAESIEDAVRYVRQGHVRVGPNVVSEPSHHVVRAHEDFVTWTNNSTIKRKILRYADSIDTYDLLGM